jgi:PAS domain S-box-containing protein
MKGYIAQRTVTRPAHLTAVRYTGALLGVVIAVLLGLWLQPVVDATVLLLVAVLTAAWFTGLWPALLAAVLATVALDYFFTEPFFTFSLEPAHIPHLLVFMLIAGVVASASAGRRTAERSLRQARDELDAKVQERTADLARTQAEAVAAHLRFRDLVNSVEGIVWEADARTFQFTFVSQQAERVLGYPVDQWLKESTFWKDHIHPDDRESAVDYCFSATRQRRDHDFEYRMTAANGQIVWLRDLVSVVVEDNEATKLRGVMIDITARKQAEDALREQADLLNLTHDSIFVRDVNSVIRYWNRGSEELYGFTSTEAVGTVSHELLRTVFPLPLEQITAQVVSTGRWEGELVHTKRDGAQVVAASRWSLQRDPQGQSIGVLETNNDVSERRRAERALREQADLLNLTHDSIFVRDMNDVIRYWNSGAEELYGWTRDEAIGQVSHRLTKTIFPAPLQDITAELLRQGRWEGELVHTTRDGSQVVVASRWSLQRDTGGQPIGILETNNNITERKRAEEALRASEEQWRAVFENNPTMYFMVDALGTILSVNPFGAEQLGYTVDTLIGQSVLKVFAEEDWDTVRQSVERCLERFGQTVTWEIRKVRRDGVVIWVRETARAMRTTDGSPVVLIACEDVTARKRAEADLRESERRHRHIFQATGVSIWEEDFSLVKAAIDDLKKSGVDDFPKYLQSTPEFIDRAVSLVRIVDVNEATLKLFGASSKDELVASLVTVFTPETREVFMGELLALAEGQPSFEGETVLKKLDGERMVVLFSVSFPPSEASFDAVLVSIMDITDRKRAEQELEELAGRLIHAQEEERSRIGRELHDHISQTLGVLTIRIDQLRADEATPPAVAAALEDLRRSTSEVSDDIHSLSHRLHSSALDYLGLVPAVQKLVNEFSARHGIAVDFAQHSVPAPLPPDVSLSLFRVTEESLANIAKHSQAKSARVNLNGGPDGLRLTIEDAGTGFDLEDLDRKAGLGFVSMRERLRVLRGTVRVDSAPARGTRIDAWVPAASLAAPPPTEVASSAASTAQQPSSNVSSA